MKNETSFLTRYGLVLVGVGYVLFLAWLLVLKNMSGPEPVKLCRPPIRSSQ